MRGGEQYATNSDGVNPGLAFSLLATPALPVDGATLPFGNAFRVGCCTANTARQRTTISVARLDFPARNRPTRSARASPELGLS
jgi:hypothetical protein